MWHQFLFCAQCRTIKYVQGPGKAQAVLKLTFKATIALTLKEKIYFRVHGIEPTFKTDLKMRQQFFRDILQVTVHIDHPLVIILIVFLVLEY